MGSRMVTIAFNLTPLDLTHPEFGMTAAVYNGFQSISEKQGFNASVSCLTGNCTFPDFTSLGVCSRCADISMHIERRIASPGDKTSGGDGPSLDNMCSSLNWAFAVSNYTYTSVRIGTLSIANHDGIQNNAGYSICSITNTTTYLAIESTKNISMSFSIANASAPTTFVLFRGLRASDAYTLGKEAWQDSQPTPSATR